MIQDIAAHPFVSYVCCVYERKTLTRDSVIEIVLAGIFQKQLKTRGFSKRLHRLCLKVFSKWQPENTEPLGFECENKVANGAAIGSLFPWN